MCKVVLRSLCALTFAAVACIARLEGAETVTQQATVPSGKTLNMDTSSGRLRLRAAYRQHVGEPIAIEAERATVLRFTQGKGEVGQDAEASEGVWAGRIQHMEFHVEVVTPGTYQAWCRALFPWAGRWVHTEQMDDGKSQTVVDSKGEVVNKWTWTRGPTYELTQGKHVWAFTPYAWMGGARLDKVVLVRAPGAKPKGLGPKALPSVLPASGTMVSEPFLRKTAVSLDRLELVNQTGKGSIRSSYSIDNGTSWRPVPEGQNLSSLPADRAIRFKLVLTADAAGAGPIVRLPLVSFQVNKARPIVLENDRVRWLFSGENGTILGLRNKRTHTDYMVPGVTAPLFSFRALRDTYGIPREISFGQAQLRETKRPRPNKLVLTYAMMGGRLLVELTVRLDKDGLTRFSMQITNHAACHIAEVIFPCLDGLRIGADQTDDYLFTPILAGSIVKYPAAFQVPRAAYAGRALTYPGMATMCWMDLWDKAGGGLYLAYEDKDYRLTELTFSNGSGHAVKTGAKANTPPLPVAVTGGMGYRYAKQPGPYIGLGFNKRILIKSKSKPVTMPDVVVGVHEGDWHWGADRYRAWAKTWMKKSPVPDWWRDAEGWNDMHMTHLGDFVDIGKGWPKGRRKNQTRNPVFPMLTVWAQQASSEGRSWGTHVLHRILGSPEQLAASVQKQHEMGHFIKFYSLPAYVNPLLNRKGKRLGIVPRVMYPDDEVPPAGFYPRVARRMYDGALVNPDGVHSDAGVCLSARPWQQYLRHIVLDKYIRTYGSDGMYLDGTGLVTYACKNLSHGHGYGEWTQGFMSWLEGVKRDARRARPGAIFSGEGMGDVEHTLLDGGLFYAEVACQAYRYTFPENIGINHSGLPGYYKEYPEDALAWICVFGLKFGGIDWFYMRGPEKFERYLTFRRRISQFQFRARFMDELGVAWGDPDLKGKLYVRDEPGTKGALLVVFNEKKKAGTHVRIDRSRVGDAKAAWAYTLDAKLHKLDVRRSGGAYEVTVPATEMSALLLMERCEPFVDIERVEPVVPGEKGTARVTVRNLDARPLVGQVTLDLPKGWQAERVPVQLDPGAERTVEIPFRVASGEKYDVHQIYGVVEENGRRTRKCIPMGVCRPVQTGLYWVKTDTVRLAMHNSSHRPVSGTCVFTAPASVTALEPKRRFSLPARGKAEMRFRLKNVASVTTREPIKAVLTYGNDTTEAHEIVQPGVLNGGFEQCLAGDGFHDYWNYRWPRHLYGKGMALDTRTKIEGRQSLRIDPYPNGRDNRISTTLVRLAPNTRYKLHAALRRSAHHPQILIQFFAMYAKNKRRAVEIVLGQKKGGPVGVWETFEQEFTSADIECPYQMILQNSTTGAATVWYDDIRIDEVK